MIPSSAVPSITKMAEVESVMRAGLQKELDLTRILPQYVDKNGPQ